MHETFEHTADVGLRMRATNVGDLLAEAGRALMGVMVENPEAEAATLIESVALKAEGTADLLFDWLSELLYLFATRRFVARDYEVRATDTSLEATVRGWQFDPDNHAGGNEVKAITYHGLKAERRGDEWLAEVILDI